MTKENQEANTHFGFQDIPRAEKQARVGEIFRRVAPKYDVMNDAMSLGLHRLWKDTLVRGLRLPQSAAVLDVAGGTGDIAFRILKHFQDASPSVTICDINPAMVKEGMARAMDLNFLDNLRWACGNAESLPFPNSSFEAYTIAFGIRNVTDMAEALKEAHRVLKPGGRFLCLEFTPYEDKPLKPLYDAYSFHVIPCMGRVLAQDEASYRYLVESIRRFPRQDDFAEIIEHAGFTRVKWRDLGFGMVAVHSGWKA